MLHSRPYSPATIQNMFFVPTIIMLSSLRYVSLQASQVALQKRNGTEECPYLHHKFGMFLKQEEMCIRGNTRIIVLETIHTKR
jgi:hypothetical protein